MRLQPPENIQVTFIWAPQGIFLHTQNLPMTRANNSIMDPKNAIRHSPKLPSQPLLKTKLNLKSIKCMTPHSPLVLKGQWGQLLAVYIFYFNAVFDGDFVPCATEPRRSVGIVMMWRQMNIREPGFRCCWPFWRRWSLWGRWWWWWWWWWWWSWVFGGGAKNNGVVLRAEGRFGEGIVCSLKLCKRAWKGLAY